jgi:hypothetical protein
MAVRPINDGNFSAKTEPKPDAPVVEKTGVASILPANGALSEWGVGSIMVVGGEQVCLPN